jgi:cell division septum initiation protein DivIVA
MCKEGDVVSNNSKDDVIELGGREIKRVKNGLDEAQVASFIDELVSERDKLAQSQDHIASLHRLAEKTITEADGLAEQIKIEAAEQAKGEGNDIIEKAKEQAKAEANDITETAKEQGQKIVEERQAEAERKAALLLEKGRKRIQAELGNLVNQQFDHLVNELEDLKQQATAAKSDFKHKLSQHREESGNITVESEVESDAATLEGSKRLDESLKLTQAMDQTDKSPELSRLFQTEDQAEVGEPQWEVEILPPVDSAKIMKVVTCLDSLPEVGNTEIIPQTDMPSITVFLRDPVDVVNVLRTIPEVAYVEETTTDEYATDSKPQKVRIGFSADTVSQK